MISFEYLDHLLCWLKEASVKQMVEVKVNLTFHVQCMDRSLVLLSYSFIGEIKPVICYFIFKANTAFKVSASKTTASWQCWCFVEKGLNSKTWTLSLKFSIKLKRWKNTWKKPKRHYFFSLFHYDDIMKTLKIKSENASFAWRAPSVTSKSQIKAYFQPSHFHLFVNSLSFSF